MAYSIDTYSGSNTFVVEDGTINNALDLRLIGKNYAGYGEVQNENFVHLLENFAGPNTPPRPVAGQIWYDTVTKKIKFYDSTGSRWKTAGGSEAAPIPPSGLVQGDFWWDNTNNQLYVFDGTSYVLVGPQGGPGLGTTQMVTATVFDNTETSKLITQAYVNGEVVFTISGESFTLSSSELIPGFSKINRGITMVGTNSQGITSNSVSTIWGTSSDSLKLGGFTSDDFLKVNDPFTQIVTFSEAGYTFGNAGAYESKIASGGPLFKTALNTFTFQTATATPLVISGAHLLPGDTLATNLGSAVKSFNNIYAASYYGNGENLTSIKATSISEGTIPTARLAGTYNISVSGNANTADTATTAQQANTLFFNGAGRAPSAVNASNTVMVRDSNGDVAVRIITGTLAGNAASSTTAVSAQQAGLLAFDGAPRAASSVNVSNTIVARDAVGDIAVRKVYGELAGNAATATTSTSSQQADTLVFNGAARSAASSGVANTIVARDSAGDIAVRRVLGELVGNASTATTALNLTGGRILAANGSAESPSIAFDSDGVKDTGFYWGGDGYINFATNGQYRGNINPSGDLTITGGFVGRGIARLQGVLSGASSYLGAQGSGIAVTVISPGYYRVYHNLNTTNYVPIVTIVTPTSTLGGTESRNIDMAVASVVSVQPTYFDIQAASVTSYLTHAGGNDNNAAPTFIRTIGYAGVIYFTVHPL